MRAPVLPSCLLAGYGHVTPLSQGGKVFCIFYAVFGIPLTLILLAALVRRLMVPTSAFLAFLENRLGEFQGLNNILEFYVTMHKQLMVKQV